MKKILLFLMITLRLYGTTYYIDATNGNDNYDGLTPETSWQTISKLNTMYFNPGDEILFKRGEEWREQFNPTSSGSEKFPIIIGAYGSGNKPIFNGADQVTGFVEMENNIYNIESPRIDLGAIIVVIDGLELKRVETISELTNGTFYLDINPSPDLLYIYSVSDPNKQKVEISGMRVDGIQLKAKSYITIEELEFRY
ncbi:MAG: hypothetical protein IPK06_02825 [Ignavibacteriae bacterium]|nr:hypothetical protein [Ignavibacteriota bacterium]